MPNPSPQGNVVRRRDLSTCNRSSRPNTNVIAVSSYNSGVTWNFILVLQRSYGSSKQTKNGTRAPFSILHPVTDMGLYDYPRPKTSIPARPITEGLLNRKSYPTNSWYQSLLVPMDEPTDIHRTYAIPYVVDTVGPMPGLRLHPNHIDASTFVIQLYVINEYGLSVGADIDATSSSPSKHGTSDSPPTHQYKVTHATHLGVTLNWVCILCLSMKPIIVCFI